MTTILECTKVSYALIQRSYKLIYRINGFQYLYDWNLILQLQIGLKKYCPHQLEMLAFFQRETSCLILNSYDPTIKNVKMKFMYCFFLDYIFIDLIKMRRNGKWTQNHKNNGFINLLELVKVPS